jgi:hypothetical protein
MKKILYIGVILLGLAFSSCSEEWMNDIVPTDKQLDKDAFKQVKDGQNALNGVYSLMQSSSYYGADYLTYGDLKAMDFKCVAVGKRGESQYIYSETADASDSGMWTRPYTCLVAINNAIDNADKMIAKTDEDKAAKIEVIANFYALRALCHFDLLKIFSKIPTTTGTPATDLGVVLANRLIAINETPQRATVQEVYDSIFSDLTEAEKLGNAHTEGYFSLNAVKALRARVHLYHGDKAEALALASEVINSNEYSLTPAAAYANSWAATYANSETIMKIVNTEEDNTGNEGIGYLMSKTGYNAIKVTDSFKALFADGDIRSSIIDADGFLKKYPDNLTNAYRIIRLSEMYMIAAECSLGTSAGMDFLNTVLEARGATQIATAAELTLDRVLLERRKELAGEGHTFFDYMRNKKNIVHTGDDHLASLQSDDKVFEYTDYRAIQPIPRKELNSNDIITQNPEY